MDPIDYVEDDEKNINSDANHSQDINNSINGSGRINQDLIKIDDNDYIQDRDEDIIINFDQYINGSDSVIINAEIKAKDQDIKCSDQAVINDQISANDQSINCKDSVVIKNQTKVNDQDNSVVQESRWNHKMLLLLRKVGKKTMGYRWMHEQEFLHYETRHTRLSIFEMFIFAFLGVLTGGGLINFISGSGLDNNKTTYIVITAIQLVTVFVAALARGYGTVVKYEKKMNDHLNASLKNAELNLSIQAQLSLNIVDRESDILFLKSVVKNFNDILFLSPGIREHTKKKYLKAADDNDIFTPMLTDLDDIRIVINYDDHKSNPVSNVNPINDSQLDYEIDRWGKHF